MVNKPVKIIELAPVFESKRITRKVAEAIKDNVRKANNSQFSIDDIDRAFFSFSRRQC